MNTEAKVAGHYTRGRLEEAILQALTQTGKDAAQLTAGDLAAVDEFHVGGREATEALAQQMELRPGLRLLDVGSGIGGPARYFAAEHGCRVAGIDLTEEFVEVAKSLTRLVKLDHLAEFRQGSAGELPFEPEAFDGAYMLHVGMNIRDKTGVYREVRRVLKPGGIFVVFDIMRTADGPIRYPVPWALTEETSFVAEAANYREALRDAGFQIERERGRRAFAIEFMERARARTQSAAPPPGLHLLMGDQARVMSENLFAMLHQGVIEPVEMHTRAA